jgi:hypothetical protein
MGVIHEIQENGISPDFLRTGPGDPTHIKPVMTGLASGKEYLFQPDSP